MHDLLLERPALIGEFSLAYEAFREATSADFAPVTRYKYLQAQQLTDLNWAILQAKASVDVELSNSTENIVRLKLTQALEKECYSEYDRLAEAFVTSGGDEDDFDDPVDWDSIALGVEPRLVLSSQLLNNSGYRRHSEKLLDLQRRAPALGGVPRGPEVSAN
jgi:hypothetical protein